MKTETLKLKQLKLETESIIDKVLETNPTLQFPEKLEQYLLGKADEMAIVDLINKIYDAPEGAFLLSTPHNIVLAYVSDPEFGQSIERYGAYLDSIQGQIIEMYQKNFQVISTDQIYSTLKRWFMDCYKEYGVFWAETRPLQGGWLESSPMEAFHSNYLLE